MNYELWESKWKNNAIGFHQENVNNYLKKYINYMKTSENIFIPLCGKSVDMIYLSDIFKKVSGVELIKKGVEDFIGQNNLQANITKKNKFTSYETKNIEILQGDFFDINNEIIKSNIFDRASLVALPKNSRKEYCEKIIDILDKDMLLVTLEYPCSEEKNPPFSVSEEEVYKLYSHKCNIKLLDDIDLTKESKFASFSYAREKVFLISSINTH